MNTIGKINNLTKEYKEFTLGPVSFEIPKGYIIGIIGPNGAGKTTTLQLLMNIISPTDGTISLFESTYPKDEKKIKNNIGYVGEEQFFYEDKSVAWTENFISGFYTNWDTNLCNNLLNLFNISRTKKIKELSKGMKVKLSLALALSYNPGLILLDEPTSGLDPVIRRELLDLLRNQINNDENKTLVISSHITDDLSRIADYIYYLVDGKIVLQGMKEDLLAGWKKIHYKTGSLPASITTTLLQPTTSLFGSSGLTSNYQQIQKQLQPEIENQNVQVENITLDDILISFVKGGIHNV